MSIDIIALDAFYQTPLGKLAAEDLRQATQSLWPAPSRGPIAIIGYGLPLAGLWTRQAGKAEFRSLSPMIFHLMPARQGVCHWSPQGRNLTALIEEEALPFPDQCFERLIVLHGLEHGHQQDALMDEIWRCLSAEGQLMLIVPGRRGLWARTESTPFGHGHPYSRLQLHNLLAKHGFTPLAEQRALYYPPWPPDSWLIRGFAKSMASLLHQFTPRLGGAILLTAKKFYAIPRPLKVKKSQRLALVKPLVTKPAYILY